MISISKLKRVPRYFFGYKFDTVRYQHLLFNITSKCNASCKYCEVHKTDQSTQLSHSRILQIFQEAKEMGIREVTLSGGEPFFYENIWELIDHILKLNLKLNIITNGLLINSFTKDEIAILKRTNQIIVSLDSQNKDINNFLRGGGSFDKTIQGIKILKDNEIIFSVGTVINTFNIDHLNEFISFCKKLNVDYISFQPLHIYSNYYNIPALDIKSDLSLDNISSELVIRRVFNAIVFSKSINQKTNLIFISQWIEKYLNHHKEISNDVWLPKTLNKFRCIEVLDRLMLNFDGSVLPCTMLDATANVKEVSLKNAVKSLDEIKRNLRKGKFPKECNKCSCQVSSNYNFSLIAFPLLNMKKLFKLFRDFS
jgi:MoaA/NifB/PqqE/SkfB family radical SAM enzyme